MNELNLQHECRECRMKFETSESLANHVKKFCINSEYGSIKKLDDKYAIATRNQMQELKPSQSGKDPSNLKSYGGYTLDHIKSNLKSEDDDFKKLEDIVLRKREDEMIDELDRLKKDRQQNKVVNEQDEEGYSQLLTEIELKKEREFQCRVERDQIKRLIGEMDSWRMSVIEEQKKKELDRLLQERETLKIKQLQLIDDCVRFTQGHRTFQSLKQSDKISNNKVVGSAQYSEIKQKLVNLCNRQQFLENERMRILDNMERIKLGDLAEVRRGASSLSMRAGQSVLDQTQIDQHGHNDEIARMRDKIAADTLRIQGLKREMGNNNTVRPPTHEQVQQYSDKVLDDLEVLKRDYEKAGGDDPKFIQNLDNLKKFYQDANNKSQVREVIIPDTPQPRQQQFQQQQHPQQNVSFNQGNQNLQQENQMMQEMLKQQQAAYQNQQQQMQKQASLRKKKGPKEIDFNDPFDSFSRKKEFFLQNNVRDQDLSKEEKILLSLTAQEVDALRGISRIPIGTEIYRFKMEQYKELSTMRAEIEKIVQEQRLQRIRRNFEKKRRNQDRLQDNNKWVDDHRKFIMDDRLRQDFGEVETEGRSYEPSEGMVVHWDYITGLPRRTRLCQVVFAVYNNMQQQSGPKLIEPIECEIEGAATNRVLIGDSNQIYEIPPNQETLLIIEIQIPLSRKLEENIGHTESFAWTMLDLFDQTKQLKRGKFKCPLYLGPTDPAITIEEIAKLEPIPNAWFHLRLTFPNDEEFEQVRSIYPEQTQMEYNIPYIHLRGLFARNYESSIKGKNIEDPPNQGDVTINGQDYKLYENTEVFRQSRQRTPQQYGPRNDRGIRFVIHQVTNHVARSQLRVMVAIMFENNLLLDAEGLPVAFNTSIHDPNSQVYSKARENDLIPLIMANPEMEGMNNKANRTNIITFHEEYRVFYDIIGVAQKAQKPMWLGFQLTEQTGEGMNNSRSATMGGFDIIAWQFVQIVGPNGNIILGRQSLNLYAPPLRRPPFDATQAVETKIKLDFTVQELKFSENQMLEWRSMKSF